MDNGQSHGYVNEVVFLRDWAGKAKLLGVGIRAGGVTNLGAIGFELQLDSSVREAVDDGKKADIAVDIEIARTRCRAYVKMRMKEHHVEGALYREGFDEQTIKEVLPEYEQMRVAYRWRQRRFTQSWGALLFLGCTGAFLYFAFFAAPQRQVFHLWLLAPAMFGLLKMLLP